MVCKLNTGMALLHHDILAFACRRAIHHAGCTTSVEPSYSSSLPLGQCGGAASLGRGNILAILPRGRIKVLVTHLAAALHVNDAMQLSGFAAAKAATNKRHVFELFVMVQVLNSFRWLVSLLSKEASRFLSDLVK